MLASGETAASGSPLARLVIRAGHHDRFMCPLEVVMGRDTVHPASYEELVRRTGGGPRAHRPVSGYCARI